jgi:hypothetical protein
MAARRDVFNELEYADFISAADGQRGEVRGPRSEQERWVARGVVTLTSLCDGAIKEDEVGFNKSDTNAGRYLGHFIAHGGLLDDEEWSSSIGLLRKYHGQIGECPLPDDEDFAREMRMIKAGEQRVPFRERLAAVLNAAKTEQKRRDEAAAEAARKINRPDVIIEREGADADGKGGKWVVSTPYNAPAVDAWRALHSRVGGGWNSIRRVREVPYKAARELNALLSEHHAGQYARGPKGVFVIPSPGEEGHIIEGTEPGAKPALRLVPQPAAQPAPAPAPRATSAAQPAPRAMQVQMTFASVDDRVAAAEAILASPNANEADIERALAILAGE